MQAPTSGAIGIVIEGATRGRRLVAEDSKPAALFDAEGKPVLRWILAALRSCGIDNVTYVGTYHFEKIVAAFPDLAVRYGALSSLGGLQLPAYCRRVILCDGDVLVSPAAIRKLLQSNGDAIGFVGTRSAKRAVAAVVSLEEFNVLKSTLGGQTGVLQIAASLPKSEYISLGREAALISDEDAVARFVFRGKGATLEQLRRLITSAVVLDQVRFSLEQWSGDSKRVLDRIESAFPDQLIIVRSSAYDEDKIGRTSAGRFVTIADVASSDRVKMAAAITTVGDSFEKDGRQLDPRDEVLIQPQLTDVAAAGVLLTRNLATGAPQFVVSYDDTSRRTDVVTSGISNAARVFHVSWNAPDEAIDSKIGVIVALGRELMEVTHRTAIDVEFAIDSSGQLHLLQVRPMPQFPIPMLADFDISSAIEGAARFVDARTTPAPNLQGAKPVLGIMPDWNPAEMIGIAPRPLALSLYQALIGTSAWSEGRALLGYRDVRPNPLILSLAGRPYVDVRASLNSFVPAPLSGRSTARWIGHCLDRLVADESLHDKVEFELMPTCLALDWPDHAKRMKDAGLTSAEIDEYNIAIGRLTRRIISEDPISISHLLFKIEQIESCLSEIRAMPSRQPEQRAVRIARALATCVGQGTVPFAMLARYAFVAICSLRNLARIGVVPQEDVDRFMQSIPTVAGRFVSDSQALRDDRISRQTFFDRYGHLRPNSYEITSANYIAAPERILDSVETSKHVDREMPAAGIDGYNCMIRHAPEANRALSEVFEGLELRQILRFASSAIAAREHAKFEFTKLLNCALEDIAGFCKWLDLNRDDASFLHIDEITRYATDSFVSESPSRLTRSVTYRRKRYSIAQGVRLPELLSSGKDLFCFAEARSRPNFVTQRSITGRAVHMATWAGEDLKGAIVVLEAADPGYDWIFSRGIGGLVTCFGGIASHMAIRAAEFDLPSAIGCGSALFEQLRHAKTIQIDCVNYRVVGV